MPRWANKPSTSSSLQLIKQVSKLTFENMVRDKHAEWKTSLRLTFPTIHLAVTEIACLRCWQVAWLETAEKKGMKSAGWRWSYPKLPVTNRRLNPSASRLCFLHVLHTRIPRQNISILQIYYSGKQKSRSWWLPTRKHGISRKMNPHSCVFLFRQAESSTFQACHLFGARHTLLSLLWTIGSPAWSFCAEWMPHVLTAHVFITALAAGRAQHPAALRCIAFRVQQKTDFIQQRDLMSQWGTRAKMERMRNIWYPTPLQGRWSQPPLQVDTAVRGYKVGKPTKMAPRKF